MIFRLADRLGALEVVCSGGFFVHKYNPFVSGKVLNSYTHFYNMWYLVTCRKGAGNVIMI